MIKELNDIYAAPKIKEILRIYKRENETRKENKTLASSR